MKVLIFDDDVAATPGDWFYPPALEVQIYDRADECLKLVAALRPDVVLMDYHMRTGYKGEQAVKDLRRSHPSGTLSIIGISSAENLNNRIEAAGADRAVLKRYLQGLLFELAENAVPPLAGSVEEGS